MIQRYYEDELRYLYQAGKEFARSHPGIARYLHIDSESKEDRDPYVERLFEGFAFLTGRIRERLDDELPELTESLCSMLWPHLLKPVPSLSVVEFRPRPGLVQQTVVFPAGTELHSVPAGEEAAVCRFNTTHEVRLQPMKLTEAALSWPPGGTSLLLLRFALDPAIDPKKLQLAPLRLYFHAEDTIASMMHLFFSRHVERLVYTAGGARCELAGPQAVRPVGLAPEEGLLPYSGHSFRGIRLLQEYMSFRRKFWFIDLLGLDGLTLPPKTQEFQVECTFNRPYPEEKKFSTDNIRLFSAPVVNLFRTEAEPLRIDHLASEYRVTADAQHPRSCEVYSVDAATGMEEETGRRHTYLPLYSFTAEDGKANEARYFTTASRIGPADRNETYISLEGFASADGGLPVETLSLEITASNGSLPREKLAERTIVRPAPDFPNVASFENLTQPSLNLRPRREAAGTRREDNVLWKMISHLSLNFVSVATLPALRAVLELYDWTDTDANRRRIAGIRSVSWAPKEMLARSAVMRGTEVTVEVNDGHFADEGDLCLFGLVLSEFYSLYATINSFVHLTIVTKPSEQRFRWQPARGSLPLL